MGPESGNLREKKGETMPELLDAEWKADPAPAVDVTVLYFPLEKLIAQS